MAKANRNWMTPLGSRTRVPPRTRDPIPGGRHHRGTVVIEGETWHCVLTRQEYDEWVKYGRSHPWLTRLPYEPILRMFLAHLRRGVNLNIPVTWHEAG